MEEDATEFVISQRDSQLKRIEEVRNAIADARESGNWDNVPPDVYLQYLNKVEVLTLPTVPGKEIKQSLGIVSAEGIFMISMPSFSDINSRTAEAEKQLQNAGNKTLEKLRLQALNCNADAVIDVKTSHNLIDNQGDQYRFMVISTGTAVKLA